MNHPDSLTPHTALKALERFVVDNDDLLALESRIGRFNIFDALRIARAEIRHSNFLAFILDPAESHAQSQLFLKALLMDLLKAAPANLRPLSPIDIDGIDLRGVEVRREWNKIDLVITCEQPSFVIAMENKIEADEHSIQLFRYKQTISQHFPKARPLYVFLTPDGAEASEDEWVSYSYGDIHRVLSRVRTTYANAIGEDVRVFLDHYLTLIGTRLMEDHRSTSFVNESTRTIAKRSTSFLSVPEAPRRDSSPRWKRLCERIRDGTSSVAERIQLILSHKIGSHGCRRWGRIHASTSRAGSF